MVSDTFIISFMNVVCFCWLILCHTQLLLLLPRSLHANTLLAQVLEYGTPKEVLGLNNQMTQILHQLLESHPAHTYHKTDKTTKVTFDTNPDASVRVIRDNLGKLSKVQATFGDDVNKVWGADVDRVNIALRGVKLVFLWKGVTAAGLVLLIRLTGAKILQSTDAKNRFSWNKACCTGRREKNICGVDDGW